MGGNDRIQHYEAARRHLKVDSQLSMNKASHEADVRNAKSRAAKRTQANQDHGSTIFFIFSSHSIYCCRVTVAEVITNSSISSKNSETITTSGPSSHSCDNQTRAYVYIREQGELDEVLRGHYFSRFRANHDGANEQITNSIALSPRAPRFTTHDPYYPYGSIIWEKQG